MPGIPELLIILVIVLLIFGAGKLPQIGDALGRSIKNFKRASSGQDELEVSKKDQLEAKKASRELDAGEVEDAEVVTKAKAKKA
ncbi:MAG: twin-arginine translocase TatA/TatE family subunit [Kofleriaceae bacterium]|jgi:sec-independent protein translocase protein TatA|nr:twin-arginine translocase TatA/TatE family subunit [Kofleriaceae bacterium]MBP6836613.1 twin-arginine translocase TatA/TatE family subunit [Kofleriaceae bacterium]MBP9206903.1 twin-arginine translocase TatA/TatE family subunit [Kofleriaceae bacterium]